jgi:hypothetical protein
VHDKDPKRIIRREDKQFFDLLRYRIMTALSLYTVATDFLNEGYATLKTR